MAESNSSLANDAAPASQSPSSQSPASQSPSTRSPSSQSPVLQSPVPKMPVRSTVLLDTSALLSMITNGPTRAPILAQLEAHTVWCASELALAEGLPAIDRLATERLQRADLEDALRLIWDWLHLVPVDVQCLDQAARLCRQGPARISDAVHVAAGLRLPPPVTFVTTDPAQVALAERAGLQPADLTSAT